MAGFGSSFCPPGLFRQGMKRHSTPDNQMKIQQNSENHDPNNDGIYQDGYVMLNKASGQKEEVKPQSSRRESSMPMTCTSGLRREDLDGFDTYRQR